MSANSSTQTQQPSEQLQTQQPPQQAVQLVQAQQPLQQVVQQVQAQQPSQQIVQQALPQNLVLSHMASPSSLMQQAPPPLPQQLGNLPPSWNRGLSSGNISPIAPCTFADDEPLGIAAEGALPVYVSQPGAEPDPVASAGALTVTTRVEYSAMPRDQMQDIFGLVTVQAAEVAAADAEDAAASAAQPDRQPTDLVCVLDVSGSMQGEKLSQVQKGLRFIVDEAQPNDRLSIVTFNSSATRVLGLKRMTAEGKDSANVATLRLIANGGTSIAAGLDKALAVMEQRRERNKVSAILLLTDGQDGGTRARVPRLLARASKANCSLYAFGFGVDHDAGLLSEIAEQARTPFTFVEDAEHCREAFAGAVGGLSSIVAQSVKLTLNCAATLKAVHTPFEVERDVNGSRAVITIPDFFAGARRDILVELAVPAGEAGKAALLDASLCYADLGQGCNVSTPAVQMEATRVDEPQPEMEPDEEVGAQRHRVEVTRALQEAAKQGDNNKFEDAQQVLTACEQRLEKGRQTPMSANLCLELKDAHRRLQSRADWEKGGRAQVTSCYQMHSMQSCTYMSPGIESMYCTPTQQAWSSKSCGD